MKTGSSAGARVGFLDPQFGQDAFAGKERVAHWLSREKMRFRANVNCQRAQKRREIQGASAGVPPWPRRGVNKKYNDARSFTAATRPSSSFQVAETGEAARRRTPQKINEV